GRNDEAIEKVVTIFRELRSGQTLDGKAKLKTPSGVLSTAEAISVLANSMALAGNFGSGEVSPQDLASALQGSVVKDEEKDRVVWQEYLANVLKKRGAEWRPLFTACNEENGEHPPRRVGISSNEPWPGNGFGGRHLSPAGAWHLRRYLDQIKPDVVLIEGLSDASELIPQVTRKGTKPPIALLAYTESLPIRTLIYPLARYSPEFQAMCWADEHDVAVEFIDLPSDVFLALH